MELIIIFWIFLSKSFFFNYDASVKIYTTFIGFGVALLIPISFIYKNLKLANYKLKIFKLNTARKLSYLSFSVFFIFSLINNININSQNSTFERPLSFLAIFMISTYGLLSNSVLAKKIFIKRLSQVSYIYLIVNFFLLLFFHELSWDEGRFRGYLSDSAIVSSISIIVSCVLTPKLFQTDNIYSIRINGFFILLNLLFAYLSGSRSCVFIIFILTVISLFSKGNKLDLKFRTNNKTFFKKLSIFTTPFLATLGYFLALGIFSFGPRVTTINAFFDRFQQWGYAFIDPKWFKGIGLGAKFISDEVGETIYTHFLDPHNLYLSTLLNLGILSGLVMLIFAFFALIFIIKKLRVMDEDYCYYLLVFSAILSSPIGGSMFSINNVYDRIIWIALSFIFFGDLNKKNITSRI